MRAHLMRDIVEDFNADDGVPEPKVLPRNNPATTSCPHQAEALCGVFWVFIVRLAVVTPMEAPQLVIPAPLMAA